MVVVDFSIICTWYMEYLVKMSLTVVGKITTALNECIKVQNPHYKDVSLNAYTSA